MFCTKLPRFWSNYELTSGFMDFWRGNLSPLQYHFDEISFLLIVFLLHWLGLPSFNPILFICQLSFDITHYIYRIFLSVTLFRFHSISAAGGLQDLGRPSGNPNLAITGKFDGLLRRAAHQHIWHASRSKAGDISKNCDYFMYCQSQVSGSK